MQNAHALPSRLHHGLFEVHLPVTDVDRAIDFYVDRAGSPQPAPTSRNFKTLQKNAILFRHQHFPCLHQLPRLQLVHVNSAGKTAPVMIPAIPTDGVRAARLYAIE